MYRCTLSTTVIRRNLKENIRLQENMLMLTVKYLRVVACEHDAARADKGRLLDMAPKQYDSP